MVSERNGHELAASGFARESRAYAKARPSYHPTVLDAVATEIGPGLAVDLGAGTGISTAALLERNLKVLAVEPVSAMRERLTESLPAAEVTDGTAESIPTENGSAVAVVVAQAFHWFDHAPALDEIARVLQPGALLVTLWNVRDESVPWMAAYTAVQAPLVGATPLYRHMTWRRAIENDARFTLESEVSESNPQPSNADHTVARCLSTSFVAALDRARQAEVETQIRAIVADLGETYDFPYRTEAQLWRFQNAAS